jgi:predicted choloylglycine hydrolase
MNADGLVASLTFGGSPTQGLGFAVILILRYVLETCSRVPEAVDALSRIPVALSQNVTLLDRSGDHATVFLNPGRAPQVSRARVCANHQDGVPSAGASKAAQESVERQRTAVRALERPGATLASVIAAFLNPPLYSRRAASPTAYSAVYHPADLRVEYVWPGRVLEQQIGAFKASEYIHDYGELVA